MKKTLIAKYDVTDLSEEQIAELEMEVAVQAEASEGHPSVPVQTEVVIVDGARRAVSIADGTDGFVMRDGSNLADHLRDNVDYGPELTQDHFDAVGVALDLMLASVNEDEPAPRTRDVLWAQEKLHDLIDRFGQFQNAPARPRRREILVHLNVEAPDSDPRDADQIADEVLRNINGGQEPRGGIAKPLGGSLADLRITVPLAEEVQA